MKLTLVSLLLLLNLKTAFSRENPNRALPFTYGTAFSGYSSDGGAIATLESAPLGVVNQGAMVPFRLEISLTEQELREFELAFTRIELNGESGGIDIDFMKYVERKIGKDKRLTQYDFLGLNFRKNKPDKDGKVKLIINGGVSFSAGMIEAKTVEEQELTMKQKMTELADIYFSFHIGFTYNLNDKIMINSSGTVVPTLDRQFLLGQLTHEINYQLHKLNNGTSFNLYGKHQVDETYIFNGAKAAKNIKNVGEHQIDNKVEFGGAVSF